MDIHLISYDDDINMTTSVMCHMKIIKSVDELCYNYLGKDNKIQQVIPFNAVASPGVVSLGLTGEG